MMDNFVIKVGKYNVHTFFSVTEIKSGENKTREKTSVVILNYR